MNESLITLWNTLSIITLILFLITTFVLFFSKFIKNRYYHEYHQDELIKKTKTANSTNYLYFTSGETYRYIKKYVISESQFDKFIVANYSELYNKISFYILCYNNKKTPFKVIEYTELATLVNGSKLIVIPKNTKNVNIVIKCVNEIEVNKNVIMPLSRKRVNAYATFSSLHIFSGLFTLRHYIARIVCTDAVFPFFLNGYGNYILVILIIIVSILAFFIAKNSNNRKNKKNLKEGGVIEYDFA